MFYFGGWIDLYTVYLSFKFLLIFFFIFLLYEDEYGIYRDILQLYILINVLKKIIFIYLCDWLKLGVANKFINLNRS